MPYPLLANFQKCEVGIREYKADDDVKKSTTNTTNDNVPLGPKTFLLRCEQLSNESCGIAAAAPIIKAVPMGTTTAGCQCK